MGKIKMVKIKNLQVKRIHYTGNNGFAILTANNNIVGNINMKGSFYKVKQNDIINVTGFYGKTGTFIVNFNELVMSSTENGVADFLNRKIKGISKRKGKEIVETLGVDCVDLIVEDYTQLTKVEGISLEKAKKLGERINVHNSFHKLAMRLVNFKINFKTVVDIYDILELISFKVLENIYEVLLTKIKLNHSIDFTDIDTIGLETGVERDNIERVKLIIYLSIFDSVRNGDTYMVGKELVKNVNNYVLKYGVDNTIIERDLIYKGIDELIEDKKVILISNNNEGEQYIYMAQHHFLEDRVVRTIKNIKKRKRDKINHSKIGNAIADMEERIGLDIACGQREAIIMTFLSNINILTGGPGTGKTQTVKFIIEVYKKLYPNSKITLTAPTGRAAKRMSEVTGLEAKTIHKILKEEEVEELNYEDSLENCDLLIIDESSMIDLPLFNNLIFNLNIEKTKILLVGDINQLKSVQFGNVLEDLQGMGISTTRLNEVFRQAEGSQIISNAYKILERDKNLDLDVDKKDFFFIETEGSQDTKNMSKSVLHRLLENGFNKEDIQFLLPLKNNELGTNPMNFLISQELNTTKSIEVENEGGNRFRINDRVMQIVNNYDLNVFNGEIGEIENIYKENEDTYVVVSYNHQEVTYINEDLEELELAYAITIHKSQGSEFDVTVIPIIEDFLFFYDINLLYTAITRAKKRVVLIGDRKVFNKILDKEVVTRNSALVNKYKNQDLEIKFNSEIVKDINLYSKQMRMA